MRDSRLRYVDNAELNQVGETAGRYQSLAGG
jgi:hypothetical protein